MKDNLDWRAINSLVKRAIREDIGKGDITSEMTIPKDTELISLIMAKEETILAGVDVAKCVFQTVNPDIEFHSKFSDGAKIDYGDVIAHLKGHARSILSAERVALNFLQHLCGIAKLTSLFVEKVKGTSTKILDTRKTVPGMRMLEKYAVRIGGGENHRHSLDSMILIKSNHIEIAGGVGIAIQRVKDTNGKGIKIEVEVRNIQELEEALMAHVDRILLDNMSLDMIHEAVRLAETQKRAIGFRSEIEASGGITLENVRSIAETGVDFISVGALTHSASASDISLMVRKIERV